MRSSRGRTTQRWAPASLSHTTSSVPCGNSSSCTLTSAPAERSASGTFLRPRDRSMKNTRGSGGSRRLELAADRFFDVERLLAIVLSEFSDRLASLVAIRDDGRRHCRRLQHRPAELDSRVHGDHPRLRGFFSRSPATSREGIQPCNEPVTVPLNTLKMQADQIAHCKLAVPGCIDHILETRRFNEQMFTIREHLVTNQRMPSPKLLA